MVWAVLDGKYLLQFIKRILILIALVTVGATNTSSQAGEIYNVLVDAHGADIEYVENFLDHFETILSDYNIGVKIMLLQDDLHPDASSAERTEHDIDFVIYNASRSNEQLFGQSAYFANTTLADVSGVVDLSGEITWQNMSEDYELSGEFAAIAMLYNVGYCAAAQQLETNLIVETPQYSQSELNYFKGTCAILAGDYHSAKEHLYGSLDTRPSISHNAYINLAWVHIQLGETEQAFARIDALVDTLPRESPRLLASVYQVQAQIYALGFDYDTALDRMNAAIEVYLWLLDNCEYRYLQHLTGNCEQFSSTDFVEALTQRGEIILLIYEWDRALADFDRAIDIAPEYAPAHYQRGILLYTMADREAALASFERYLELAPDGEHAETAHSTIGSIQIELDALGG